MAPERWSVPGYTEVRELGRGSGGTVVLATLDGSSTPVAIKYLAPELLRDRGFVAEFRDEAQLLAEVDTPHVVKFYEYQESDSGAAIIMELVDGVSLRTMLREQGPTEPESALWMLKGSLLGLGAAHDRGVVHRDYKPENVLVGTDGVSKLTDFGIAARVGVAGVGSGTPLYMAPEQWGSGAASPQTDVYAATATFFESLTGHAPFPMSDLATLQRQHEQAPVPVDELPEPVRDLVTYGMAKDPQARPPDAHTLLDELNVAATAGYGAGWEERGRRRLAERAALLALLFPLAGAAGATAVAATTLGGGVAAAGGVSRLVSSPGRIAALVAAAVLLFGGAAVVINRAVTINGAGPPVSAAAPGSAGAPQGNPIAPGNTAPGNAPAGNAPAGNAPAGNVEPGNSAPANAGAPRLASPPPARTGGPPAGIAPAVAPALPYAPG